jgi:phosphoribosylformylglycinamidine cyclo-ligase
VNAFAHITGGGIVENLPRVLPEGLSAVIDARAWPLPRVFGWLERAGGIARGEMVRTFNCGIGMIAVVPETATERALDTLRAQGEEPMAIGRVERRPGPSVAVIENLDAAWRG